MSIATNDRAGEAKVQTARLALNGVDFRPEGPADMPNALLASSMCLFGVNMHVIAIRVGYSDGSTLQLRASADEEKAGHLLCAAHPDRQQDLDELYALTGADGHLETAFIEDAEYVIHLQPFAD